DLDKLQPYIELEPGGRVGRANPPGLLFWPAGRFTRWIRERALYRFSKRAWQLTRGQAAPIKYFRVGHVPDRPILDHAAAQARFGRLQSIDVSAKYNGQFEFYNLPALSTARQKLWQNRLDRNDLYLRQLITESRQVNPEIRVLLVYIPAMEVFAPGGIVASAEQSRSQTDRPLDLVTLRARNPFYQRLQALAASMQVQLLDGQVVFFKSAAQDYFPGDAHLNASGHARLANAISDVLAQDTQ
ncbi:MAG: SGNH/GDSL hydrolase family protein, partial [Leptospiraceae bacterium]|nr:SGNH/GDSL hydrolase family protein [Leptospiraceae bacterium]